MSRLYKAKMPETSVSTAKTLVQLGVNSGCAAKLVGARVSQRNSTTSAMQRVQILLKSAAATVTSRNPDKTNENDPASLCVGGTALTGYNASGEGTDGTILLEESFNVLAGWSWVPKANQELEIKPGALVALKFPDAPATALTAVAEIDFEEIP